ncbi:hypothetical protein FHL15_010176 [Xylaria flabelliformis]|uniref:Uncharacterized protein n=1 Tax=Xylaria flabelliformis TaxID=2512241 RepID=A0A553HLW0_9PEZI|nr:hypothetical protein FHL15_010176 [Xylaria flabelliformis]
MAYLSSLIQNHSSNPHHTYCQTQAEADVYDLDDPYLVPKILSQQQQRDYTKFARSITCRFLAIPLNEPYAFFHNIAQYGHVIHESRNKLIMRLPYHSLDLLNRVRQAWVSKYLTPFVECHITFDVPRQDPGRTTLVIIQRVFPRINKNGADALVVDNGIDAVASHHGRTVSLPGFSREDAAVPHLVRRVCNYGNGGGVWW